MTTMIGTVVGNYQILDLISVGGMGSIYRGQHTLIGRYAAIKVLNPELTHNHEVVNRFFNEAKATTKIRHPGIVEVFDYGYMDSGDAYLVMELLEGMSLAQRIKVRGRMTEGEAALAMRGVATALAAAHAVGIVHRDLKPDNVFLVPDAEAPGGERVKLLDFGIAKLTSIGPAGSGTRTGSVLGTPTYMSPEQCRGTGEVDHRSDLYSIGCMLYELVAGRPPFVRDGAGELIGSHLFVEPEPVRVHAAEVSPEFDALVANLLNKDPAQRLQTAREVADRLSELAQRQFATALATPYDLRVSGTVSPTPMLTPVHDAPTRLITEKPTTLSGAASVVTPIPGQLVVRGRKLRIAAIAVASIAMGFGVFFVVNRGGGSDGDGSKAAAPRPAEVLPAKPPETKPAEEQPSEAKPAEAKPAATEPTDIKPGEAKPGEAKPGVGDAKPGEAKPGEAKPAEAKPGDAKPADAKPGDKKAEPATNKPGDAKNKPRPPGSKPPKPNNPKPKPPGELLETDV